MYFSVNCYFYTSHQGWIHDFKLGGGGAHLKKLCRAEGGAKNFGVSCVKNLDFTPKKSDFFQMQREARKFLGYFAWKITILRQKIIFFPILGGARAGCAPWIRPCNTAELIKYTINEYAFHFKSMSIDNTDELKLNKFETIIFLLLLNRIVCMILFYIILYSRANEPHNTFSIDMVGSGG